MSYHDEDDVIGFCADMRHPYGCQGDFRSVEDVKAYYAAIPPPPSILDELKACGDDPLAKANVMIRSLADYINKYSMPLEWPDKPPKRGWWQR